MSLLVNFRSKINKSIKATMLKEACEFEILNLNKDPKREGNAIYASLHYNTSDVPVVLNSINDHAYLLVGKQRLKFRDWLGFFLNGRIVVSRKSKKSRNKSKEKQIKLLKKNKVDLVIFLEGTWNRSENKIVENFYWGLIDIAYETGNPIIPLVVDYDEENKKCYTKFCDPIYIRENYNKKEMINQITEVMSTERYKIWEKYSNKKRSEVSYDTFDKKRKEDTSYLEWGKEQRYLRKNNDHPDSVFENIRNLEYNRQNSFMFKDNKNFMLNKNHGYYDNNLISGIEKSVNNYDIEIEDYYIRLKKFKELKNKLKEQCPELNNEEILDIVKEERRVK